MPGIREKSETLRDTCKRVMHAFEETDGGGSRANGGMYDHWFDKIPGWFHPFGDLPDGQALRKEQKTMVQDVCKYLNKDWPAPPGYRDVIANNNPELKEVEAIEKALSGWTGLAAKNFSTNYLDRFDSFTQNLYTASFVAHQALAAEAKLWETAHKDIHRICDEAQRTVDAMIAGCLSEGFNFALTVLGSVVEVASAQPGETALTVVQELAGAGDLFTAEGGSAKTPIGILEPLEKSVDRLKKDVKDKEQGIKEAIDANIGYLNAHKKEYVASPIAWQLAHTDPESSEDRNSRPADERGKEQEGRTTLGDDEHVES